MKGLISKDQLLGQATQVTLNSFIVRKCIYSYNTQVWNSKTPFKYSTMPWGYKDDDKTVLALKKFKCCRCRFIHALLRCSKKLRVHVCMCAISFSHVWLFVTLWIVACQALLSMGFSRQEYWSGLLCVVPPGDLADPGIKLVSLISPALAGEFSILRSEPSLSILKVAK